MALGLVQSVTVERIIGRDMLKIAQARTSLGSSNPGTELAPEAIIDTSLSAGLVHNKLPYQLLDPVYERSAEGQTYHRLLNFHAVVDFNRELYARLTENVTADDQLLTLGGDHSIGIGSMSAAKKIWPQLRVIYIDAHPDCHPHPEDTTSGNIHGLPVSTVLGDGIATEFNWPHLGYDEIAMIGLKDIDPDEQAYLDEHRIKHYTIDTIIERGIGPVVGELMDWVGEAPLHVALDIDSVDVSEAPGTGIINKGGLNYREISYLCRQLTKAAIKAVDVVEINPSRDQHNQTVELGAELALTLLGTDWTPYTRYLVRNREQRLG